MLGANSGKPDRETPKQRRFDYQAVWADLASHGWNTSRAATISFTPDATVHASGLGPNAVSLWPALETC
jgi:hypothetical protein